ncbi:MAG: hypothetical protein R2795_12660 [Saprospiraceae bacterium]
MAYNPEAALTDAIIQKTMGEQPLESSDPLLSTMGITVARIMQNN